MSMIPLLFSLLWPSVPEVEAPSGETEQDGLRYRGIEALLARFEADAQNR